MNRRTSAGDRTVGYGRPPASTRFKPGQSGNPRGRPRRRQASLYELLETELTKLVTVHQDGASERITRAEALMRVAFSRALKGDPKMISLLLKQLERRSPAAAYPSAEETEAVRASLREKIESIRRNLEHARKSGL